MAVQTFDLLAISGSLRLNSSNTILLDIIRNMLPSNIKMKTYDGLGSLPHFNDSADLPASVIHFHKLLEEADVVLICSPEYAFGIPGSLKNALDWTVGTGNLVDKPVSLITASSSGDKAHAALLLTLTALSAKIIYNGTLLIPFIRAKIRDNKYSKGT